LILIHGSEIGTMNVTMNHFKMVHQGNEGGHNMITGSGDESVYHSNKKQKW